MSYTAKDRIERLERALDNWVGCMFRHTATMEKLGEQLSEIQCEVINLKRLAKAKPESE